MDVGSGWMMRQGWELATETGSCSWVIGGPGVSLALACAGTVWSGHHSAMHDGSWVPPAISLAPASQRAQLPLGCSDAASAELSHSRDQESLAPRCSLPLNLRGHLCPDGLSMAAEGGQAGARD